MKQRFWVALAAVCPFCLLCAAAAAQKTPTSAPTPAVHRAKEPMEMESVTGTVRKYKPGKTIVIVGADGKSRNLVLDATTRIDGPVARGQEVTAVWMTDGSGKKHVSAISTSPAIGSAVGAAMLSTASASPGSPPAIAPTTGPASLRTPPPTAPPITPTPGNPSDQASPPAPGPTPRS